MAQRWNPLVRCITLRRNTDVGCCLHAILVTVSAVAAGMHIWYDTQFEVKIHREETQNPCVLAAPSPTCTGRQTAALKLAAARGSRADQPLPESRGTAFGKDNTSFDWPLTDVTIIPPTHPHAPPLQPQCSNIQTLKLCFSSCWFVK